MDVLKPVSFALLASVLVVMWLNRDYVVDAYTSDEAPAEIRFSGVALDFEKTELPASPFVVHSGDDTRRRPMALLFTDAGDEPTIEMTGGTSRIEGTVTLDGEPAVGGTVRLERHTSLGAGVRDLPIFAGGRFSARDLPGGRYRVRAWLPGTATMTTSDVFFVDAGTEHGRSYALQRVPFDSRIEFADGGTMYVGMSGSFGASVTQHRVDDQGIIVTRPVPGASVSAQFSDQVTVLSPEIQTTDERGLVVFRLRCRRAGQGTVVVTFDDRILPVPLPPCVAAPPTTAAPPTASAPAVGPAGGGEGRRGGPPTTSTTTTAPRVGDSGTDGGGGAGADGGGGADG